MALRLSENKVDNNCIGARSSDNNDFTHCNLVAAAAATATIARYSASMEERVTMRCFVELQEIGLAQMKIRKALVEVRSSGLPCNTPSR